LPSEKTVKERGSIVNISSVNGIVGLGLPGYSAAKAAVQSLTRTGSQFYGPYNVRLNAISPGSIASDGFPHWVKTLKPEIQRFVKEDIIRATPVKRQAHVEEIAAAVCWLLSDDSTFMNGANVVCDGGFIHTRFSAEPGET
jgi:NAD(P)-dependent dehydrogenase (short-subunit alcohol dehydrogenase family)